MSKALFTLKNKFKKAFMEVAETFAALSHAERKKVGSIIVKDNRIISIGYNGMPTGWDNVCETKDIHDYGNRTPVYGLTTKPEVLHAEANAISKVARSNESTEGAEIFCTAMPCIDCAKLIHQSGIKKVYYKEDYKANVGYGRPFLEKCEIELEQI
jgi:dCMP deaminase